MIMEIKNNYVGSTIDSTTRSSARHNAEKNEKDTSAATVAKSEVPTANSAYLYEPSKATEQRSEATYKPNMQTVEAMKKEAEERTKAFREMIEKLIIQQSGKASRAEWKASAESEQDLLLNIDDATRAAAAEAIGEDGYYGIEKTAERILDFAKAISGGDPAKIEMLRGAVEKGFGAATKSFGKELPDISQKTYEKVMKGFDDWANEHKTGGAE